MPQSVLTLATKTLGQFYDITNGQGYEALKAAFERLAGTRISTNIVAGQKEEFETFGIIERAKIVRETRDGRMQEVEVKISDCISGYRASDKGFLPLSVATYVELLDWTARIIRSHKRGSTPEDAQPIFDRLGISSDVWCELVRDFGRLFYAVAGQPNSRRQAAIQDQVSDARVADQLS